ncbi:MAG: FIST C-terminal domain-containing protein [Burkholderiales bacterium]|nr:FIST C-terminal domain-containing protein [Burkholderiales bacterium]
MTIATVLARGLRPTEDIAHQAVSAAMERAQLTHANSVLLFLTPEFARDPQPALRAASKAANCMQVIGCSAAGIFTEEDWVLDTPAAAAMVFGGGVALAPAHDIAADTLVFSLAAPNAINSAWIKAPGQRFGGISGDATGQGPFKVWCGAKVAAQGRCETLIQGAHGLVGVSQGIRALTAPLEITQVSGYDVISLTSQPALNILARELPLEVREQEHLPLHLIMAGVIFGEPNHAISEGRYRLTPIISTNADDRSVTLSSRLSPGDRLFWALRQPLAAERNMRITLDRMDQQMNETPDFGLFFPCMGRGPYFYGGVDRDLDLVKARYPGMPMIGFYGNGEIGPLNGENEIFQYSAVLGLFKSDV